MNVRFYRNHEAFPATRREDDEIRVVVRLDDDDLYGEGCDYEFGIAQVSGHTGALIGLQLRVFDDAWRVFQDMPEFIALLGTLDQSDRTGGHNIQDLDAITPALLELGWIDITDRYSRRVHHVQGCLTCGVIHLAKEDVTQGDNHDAVDR